MFSLGRILKFLWMKKTENVCYYVVPFPYSTSHHRTDPVSWDVSAHTLLKLYPLNLMIIAFLCSNSTAKVKQSFLFETILFSTALGNVTEIYSTIF